MQEIVFQQWAETKRKEDWVMGGSLARLLLPQPEAPASDRVFHPRGNER